MATYIVTSHVRRLVNEHGKRCSVEFLEALDRHVAEKIEEALAVHNGGKRTLDATIISYVTGKLNLGGTRR